MRAFQIIAFILSIVFTIWFIVFVFSNGRISNEEFMPVGVVYGLFMIAFSAVHLFGSGNKSVRNDDQIV